MNSISAISNVPAESVLWGDKANAVHPSKSKSFETLFQSALDMINETNELTNKAEEEEIRFAIGDGSLTDLMAAQQKASISMQYTVAVRNSILDAYKELMNLQF